MSAQPISLAGVMMFAAVPAAAVIVGGVVAAVRTPGPKVQSAVQHVAAGVLFAALATELLPDVVHRRLPWVTLGGFALGVIAMLLLKALARRLEEREEKTAPSALPTSLLLASALDIALDGLLIGVSFAAGERQGLLITIAMTLEVLFLGVATAAAVRGLNARRLVLATTITFAVLLMAGAGIGAYFLASASPIVLDGVLSFGVAALLYLVTEELLTEAHEVDETPVLTSMFFVGFLALLMIEMMV
ncbi:MULTISPECIES: ZIP family metal transporter [Roseateles]|jgi:ZIP family zinc transporter|uniref:Transporter n=3 Tax=cellular organisms TaxID=131567 RepID=A0A254NAF2_9BURK|nr:MULTISPECIES: transporter [Roseateles]MBY0367107.1 transporter [Burkholderiaceae bacterium]RTL39940.1 MAG: transporter [Burkholderiales bacterium]MCY4754349.1 transporter [Pelomonas aquatica]MDG0854731.1 transporter [Roseateles puraquae]MDG0861602.1 transporter [Pelomonas aquatica]|mmetsp:Transcript_5915/g.15037  ORF Transcript_5915/g.15037 Transcript_5915/m.15037 type:complete len:246 (-) Transcript_5915:81-818(-)